MFRTRKSKFNGKRLFQFDLIAIISYNFTYKNAHLAVCVFNILNVEFFAHKCLFLTHFIKINILVGII